MGMRAGRTPASPPHLNSRRSYPVGNPIHDIANRHTARVSRRGVLTAGALGVAAGLAAASHASAHALPPMIVTSEEEIMRTNIQESTAVATPPAGPVTAGRYASALNTAAPTILPPVT